MTSWRFRFVVVGALLAMTSLPAGAANINCGDDVTLTTGVARSGYRLNRRANRFVQTVTLTNVSNEPMTGPFNLVLDNLSSNATLTNTSGASPCPVDSGAPYISASAGTNEVLAPGQSLDIVLLFNNTTLGSITYSARVFASQATTSPVGGITVSPDAFLVNTSTLVTFHVTVPYVPANGIPVVTLEQLDASDNVLSLDGTLVDTGNLSAGDDIQGDGVFSVRRTYLALTQTHYRYRMRATLGAVSATSAVFSLDAFLPITDAELQIIHDLQSSAEQNYKAILASQGLQAAVTATLALVKASPNVLDAGVSGSGNGVWILYADGVLGGLILNPVGTLGGAPPIPLSLGKGAWMPGLASTAASPLAAAASVPPNTQVGNTKVALISPFLSSLSAYDVNPSLKTLFDAQTCPKFDVTMLSDGAVTVDALKGLSQYGIINWYGHGDTFYNGLLSLWTDQFGWKLPGAQVVLLTGQVATTANKVTYQLDLKKGRLAIVTGGGDYYAILPSFISDYGGSYPSSLVFINACRSMFNNTMSSAFLNKGAAAYLGYSEIVLATFAAQRSTDFYDKWVTQAKTAQDSFTPGLDDGNGAEWKFAGDGSLEVGAGELKDGGFESGSLGTWSAVGDGRIIGQLGAYYYPTEGSQMGIISTGLGFTTSSGSLSQKICVPTDAKTLSFDWNFTSEEFREYCGSIFQDFFRVEVDTPTGTQTLFNRRVDDLCASTVKVPFSFDRGDAWSVGWQSTSINISALAAAAAGKPITLRFSAGDVGDSIYDTAVTLDKIVIVK
jgi:hypothetical protein